MAIGDGKSTLDIDSVDLIDELLGNRLGGGTARISFNKFVNQLLGTGAIADGISESLSTMLPSLVDDAIKHEALVVSVTGGFFYSAATHQGRVVRFNSVAEGDVVLPRSAPVGSAFSLVQSGVGRAHFVREDAGNLANLDSYTRTAGKWAHVSLVVVSNAGGNAAEWVLAGATAP